MMWPSYTIVHLRWISRSQSAFVFIILTCSQLKTRRERAARAMKLNNNKSFPCKCNHCKRYHKLRKISTKKIICIIFSLHTKKKAEICAHLPVKIVPRCIKIDSFRWKCLYRNDDDDDNDNDETGMW